MAQAQTSDLRSAMDQLTILSRRAEGGDDASLIELRQLLAQGEYPCRQLKAQISAARSTWLRIVAGEDEEAGAELSRTLDRRVSRLVRTHAGAVERLLAEWVALAEERARHFRDRAERAGIDKQNRPKDTKLEARAKRAERDSGTASRALRDFQMRCPAGV